MNVAHSDDDNRVSIANGGVIPLLVALLQNGTYEAKGNATEALEYLACNQNNRVLIAKAGAIPALVVLLQHEVLRDYAAEVLKVLSRSS